LEEEAEDLVAFVPFGRHVASYSDDGAGVVSADALLFVAGEPADDGVAP
jgi:hypothetical protein